MKLAIDWESSSLTGLGGTLPAVKTFTEDTSCKQFSSCVWATSRLLSPTKLGNPHTLC